MNKTLNLTLGALAALLVAASPASAAIVVNEVESDGGTGVADWIELANTGPAAVDISDYIIKDSNDNRDLRIAAGTTLAPGAFLQVTVDGVPKGFGLGSADSARVYTSAGAFVDGYTWTNHAAATYGICPQGMHWTQQPTPGAANVCPGTAPAWPGSADVATVDDAGLFPSNLSGLAYQSPGVLWAVQNGSPTGAMLYRLLWNGTKFTPDTANGWAMGKQLVFADGTGVPDAEGVTLAGGDANGIYVSIERNDDGPNSTFSRPSVLRYDVSAAGMTLKPTNEWNLIADLPGLDANAGLEAITWVPDSVLVEKGFRQGGAPYNPASLPGHGDGLFLVGVEQDASIRAYALNRTTGAFTAVAQFASGFPQVMDLEYEPETKLLWAVCDDGCAGRAATLDVGQDGRFAVKSFYERPAGMPNANNEGFAIAPQSECVNGLKAVFYSDDTPAAGHALRAGKIRCTVAPKDTTPQPGATPTPTPMPSTTAPTTTTQPGTTKPQADRSAPQLKLAATIRRTGAFSATITLNERANLTLTAKAGKRTILKTTRSGAAAGTTTVKVKLSRSARKGLRKGQKITLTVQARDLAGNLSSSRVTAKVR